MAGIPDMFEGRLGCGHEGRVSLASVPIDKRFSRVKFLEERGRCSACFAKTAEKERIRESTESTRWAAQQGLPALRGTVKQIAFGETVRRDLLMEAYRVLVEEGDWDEDRWAAEVQDPAELVGSAHWWIEQAQTLPAMLPDVLAESEPMRALAWEADKGAIPIVGSAAQVAWARRVRFSKVAEARAALVEAKMSPSEFTREVEEPACRVNSARWWLDQAEAPGELLPDLLAAAGNDAYVENVESER